MLKGVAGTDSGTGGFTLLAASPPRVSDGQYFTTVKGIDALAGKKGEVTLSFVGIQVNPGGDFLVEYGTWRILAGRGTGIYKSWRGGGRWTAVLQGTARGHNYSIGWEGLVTQ